MNLIRRFCLLLSVLGLAADDQRGCLWPGRGPGCSGRRCCTATLGSRTERRCCQGTHDLDLPKADPGGIFTGTINDVPAPIPRSG